MAAKERRGWSPSACALLTVMLGLAAWVHRQPLLDVLEIGLKDEEQSYIFLVPFIVVWLLWLRWLELPVMSFRLAIQ